MSIFGTFLSGSQGLHLSGTLAHTGSYMLDGEIQIDGNEIRDSGGAAAIAFDGNQNVSLPKAGAVSLTIGSDADDADRSIVFGHSTLKSRIGIDDSADVFAINTDQNFEASNDLEIDASGNITVGNGNLIIDGGEINGPSGVNGALKLYANGNVTVEIDSDNSSTDRHFIVSANNETPKLKVSEDGDIYATGVLLMSGSNASRFAGDVIIEDNLIVDDDVTIGSSNSDTLTLNATIAGNVDVEDRIRHVGNTNTQMRFVSDNKISFEAAGVAMQLWNGNSSPKENVFNESGADIDFRIETNNGDNKQYTFLVDGSTGRIGMGYGDSNALEDNSRLSVQGFVSIKDPESSDMMIQLTGSSDDAKIQLYSNNVLATEINAAGDSVFSGKLQFSGSLLNTEGEDTITFDEDQRVGIGGISPTYKLDVDGDIRIRGNDIRDNSGNAAIQFDGSANTAINGLVNAQRGFTHPLSTQVNAGANGVDGYWIPIAESIAVVQNQDTQSAMFLVSFHGREITDEELGFDLIVSVRLTGKSSSPYYYADGSDIIVEPVNYQPQTNHLAFDPTTDIKLEYDTDFTSKLWVRLPVRYKDVFVTHLGAGAGDVLSYSSYSDNGWKILTGQSWAASSTAGSRHTFTGVLADKQFNEVRVNSVRTPQIKSGEGTGGQTVLSFSGSNINSSTAAPVSIMATGNGVIPHLMITSRATVQSSGPEFNMRKYASDGGLSVGENMGEIRFMAATGSAPHGFDTVDYGVGAVIIGEVGAGTWTDGVSQPGRLLFGTTPDGSTGAVERMAIDADGTVSVVKSLKITGTTPTITIGDAGAEDTKLLFDGNAQDFYVGLDDGTDELCIGVGSTVGSNRALVVTNDPVSDSVWIGKDDGNLYVAGNTYAGTNVFLQAQDTNDFLNISGNFY